MKLAEVPTTNLRIVVTLGVFVATAAVYLGLAALRLVHVEAKAWEPSEVWLAFIAVMSGLDWVQFRTKRQTHTPPDSSAPAGPAAPVP